MSRLKVFDNATQTWVYADKSLGLKGDKGDKGDKGKDGQDGIRGFSMFTGYQQGGATNPDGRYEFYQKDIDSADFFPMYGDLILDQKGYLYKLVSVVSDPFEAEKIGSLLGPQGPAGKESSLFVIGSGTTDSSAKTSTWLGTCEDITEYYDGLAIRYKIGVAGQTTTTLNINGLGAKPVYLFNTTKLTTQFPVNSIINLIYHADLNSGCWMCSDYDSNTNTYQRVYPTTTNTEYPITTRYNTTTGSSYYAEYGRYSTGVTLNPSTNTITATAFKGKLTGNADTATKATQDASGNNIASTYAKVTNAEEWVFTLEDGSTVTKKVVLA